MLSFITVIRESSRVGRQRDRYDPVENERRTTAELMSFSAKEARRGLLSQL
jgi:hypothetical protein